MRIGIVGVGNLGGVIARRLIATGLAPDNLTLVARSEDTVKSRYRELAPLVSSFDSLVSVDLIVLAVKPQDAPDLCLAIKSVIKTDAVILSVMAGVSCYTITSILGRSLVARAMPNLGASVGESATVYFIPPNVPQFCREYVEIVVNACGLGWIVDREELLDVATAVAGSGPAYLCWLGEQVESVALSEGLSSRQAHAIVLQTFKGAIAALERSGESFGTLRTRVTSPNGTTAAAISTLENASVSEHIRAAVLNALKRSRQLGSEASS